MTIIHDIQRQVDKFCLKEKLPSKAKCKLVKNTENKTNSTHF